VLQNEPAISQWHIIIIIIIIIIILFAQ